MTATFVNNVGVQTRGSQAYMIDSDTFVFGAADGGLFKMVAVDASGSFKECRYMKESLAHDASAVKSNWPSANKGGSAYSVKNVKIPATCASDAAPPATGALPRHCRWHVAFTSFSFHDCRMCFMQMAQILIYCCM